MKANKRRWAGHAVHLGTHGTIVTLACLFPSAWLIIFAVLDAYYVPRMWVNTEERYLLTLEVEKRCGTLDDLKGVDWGVQEHLDAIRAKQSGRFGVGHEVQEKHNCANYPTVSTLNGVARGRAALYSREYTGPSESITLRCAKCGERK